MREQAGEVGRRRRVQVELKARQQRVEQRSLLRPQPMPLASAEKGAAAMLSAAPA
jgi:hypothetical protein